MIKIGLTGNIGSGKTTVSKIFESLGVPVFYADSEAKSLYTIEEVKEKLRFYFSNSIFDKSGQVDFKSMAEIVFSNKSKLKQLTDILHPMVFEKYHSWLETNFDSPYSIHESAIIFEYGQQKYFDKTICVTSPLELRIERVMGRDNISVEKITQRINNQMQESEKAKLSDFIITNNLNSFLIPQVMELHNTLKK